MHRVTLVSFIALLGAVACLGQIKAESQSQAQQGYKLSGTVVNAATGEPVGNAAVQVNGSNRFFSTTSARDGHFELIGVPAGRVVVIVNRVGYFVDGSEAQSISVSSDVTGLSIKLSPLSKITGRLMDREAEPIEGVQVLCRRSMVQMGRRQDVLAASATSDDQGYFVIDNLAPGSYFINTHTTALYPGASSKAEASRYIYPETFYPGTQDRESAQPIDVRVGGDVRVDITLHSARGIRVRTTTQPHYRFMMVNMVRDGSDVPINGQIDETQGGWTFSGLTAGAWKVSAYGPFGPGQGGQIDRLYGETEFQVTSQDIGQVTIPLNKLSNVQLTTSGTLKNAVQITLKSASGEMVGTQVTSNARAQIPELKPGTYNVSVESFGQCISSVMAGSQDLLREPLIIQPGSSVPPIQINAGSNCADLTLSLPQGASAAAVVLGNGSDAFAREVKIGSQGVSMSGLPAGEYRVFAFNNLEGLEYQKADVMRSYKSQTVSLGPGQKTSLTVEVNERRE